MFPEQLFTGLEIDLHRRETGRYTHDFGQRQMYRIAPVRTQAEGLFNVRTNDLR
jgi:hypothetical protein